jgi:membrane protein
VRVSNGGAGGVVDSVRDRLDAIQQRHGVIGFPVAVIKKYGDDEGVRHAALLTYYGFLSVFPLLLLAVAVISEVLRGNPDLRNQIIAAIVPAQFQATVESALAALPSSGVPLAIAVVGLLLSGLGILNSAFHTINQVAAVPHRKRLTMPHRYLRVVLMLLLLVLCVIGIGILTVTFGALTDLPRLSRLAAFAGSVALLFLLLWSASAMYLPHRARLSVIWPAALIGSIVVAGVLTFGATVLPRLVARSGAVYGSFATIVGVFTLMFVVGQVLVFSAEVAVVRRRRLWPRSLDTQHPTDADRRALTALARTQERIPVERIEARFDAEA